MTVASVLSNLDISNRILLQKLICVSVYNIQSLTHSFRLDFQYMCFIPGNPSGIADLIAVYLSTNIMIFAARWAAIGIPLLTCRKTSRCDLVVMLSWIRRKVGIATIQLKWFQEIHPLINSRKKKISFGHDWQWTEILSTSCNYAITKWVHKFVYIKSETTVWSARFV